jgi:hypothetical protein
METCPICKSKDSKFEFVRHEQVIISIAWDGTFKRRVGKVLYESKKGKCTKCGAQIPLSLAPKPVHQKGERHDEKQSDGKEATAEK